MARHALTWAGIVLVATTLAVAPFLAFAQPIAPSTKANAYRAHITREAQMRFGVPAPVPVIAGQIQQESAWSPTARSPAGAMGLMQFMPATAEWAETVNKWGAVDPYNPAWSIRAGIWYDRWLYDRVRTYASECDRWLYVLSAYNGGLGFVYKRQALSAAPGFWDRTGTLNPGILPANQRENEAYGPRIVYRHQPGFAKWGRTVCLERRP